MKCIHNRFFQILFLIFLYVFIAGILPKFVHQFLFSLSLSIKELLLWILPLTVAFFIAHTIQSFEHRAPTFIIAIVIFELCSNFLSVWYGYICGYLAQTFVPVLEMPNWKTQFDPLWTLSAQRPSWWSVDKGVLAGLVFGIIAAFSSFSGLQKALVFGKAQTEYILTHVFARLMPIFILGFVAQILQTRLFENIIVHYSVLVFGLVGFVFLYLLFLFALSAQFSFSTMYRHLTNLLPAGTIALSSSSSLSTMPWTIEATAKNLKNPHLAQAIIPTTTNIQQIGDCIANAFLCFLVYRNTFGHVPDMLVWFNFSLMFVVARFATAGIMGGAIFVMLPIYEKYLSFNSEMIAIILAFNVILDPIITSSNVMANGALASVFEKVWNQMNKKLGYKKYSSIS